VKSLIILILYFIFSQFVNAADFKGARDDLSFFNIKNSNYKKGIDAINQAEKLYKKDKKSKSKKRFNDAINYFVLAHEEEPNNPDILYYLGISYSKVNDLMMAEIYYLMGLEINPNHTGLNQYLGNLYVSTNRIDLALERLKVLKDCDCEEYLNLKSFLDNKKN